MNVARKLARSDARLETGTVERTAPALEVRLGDEAFTAKRAKSCLVEGEVGNRVLCAVEAHGVFVLAVLESADDGASTRLVSEGDLDIVSRGGRVAVRSTEGVDIAGAEVNVRGKKGTVAVEELGFLGRALRADVGKATLVAQELDAFCTRVMSRAKQVMRFVEELDQTRAGTIDQRARNTVAIRGENAVISARVLAKIDGEQIHLG